MKHRAYALAALVAAAGVTGCGYNQIQTYDEQASQAKGQIEVQLQRRADLIPNLVNTVKGYAKQESQIFTDVARAQSVLRGALSQGPDADPHALANADAQVSRSLVPLFAFASSFPQLKSDQQFMRLQDELTGTENRIATARTDYNQAVQQYNTLIRQMPTAITARVTGAKPREYFEVTDPAARVAPTVDFSDIGTARGGTGGTGSAAAGAGTAGAPDGAKGGTTSH